MHPAGRFPARVALFALIALVGAWLVPTGGAAVPPGVLVAEVDGIIHPVSAEFMIEVLDRADREGAALTVFVLRTPGGLVDSTRDIITRMLRAKSPVAIWIGPSGARAASAGFLLTIAADVAAMAPGTSVGAAHPVSGDGAPMDPTMSKKVASDLAAYARSLASRRLRNVPFAEQAVTDSRAFTEQEAATATPPLVDVIASDVNDLVRRLDGRTITRFDGTQVKLATAGAVLTRVEMRWQQRVLSAVAHPQIAYLLLSLGTLGLTIELWNPGAVLPGVVGGLCLLLAFFGLSVLPVNYAGLALLAFGLVLLVLEIKVASFGLLAVGGITSLLFGSLMLFDSDVPALGLGLGFVLPLVLGFASVVLFLVRLGVQAQRRPATTGVAGMLRSPGTALTALGPGVRGQVSTHGEIWNAVSDESIDAGATVRVVGVDGLTIRVVRRPPDGETS